MGRAALLLLADGRFPAGGHAHSGGVEAAHAAGYLSDLASLGDYVRGRLETTGLVEAAFTARVAANLEPWPIIDDALDVRMLSPRVRSVSRSLGRQMLRTGRQVWRDDRLDAFWDASPNGAHQAVALGAVAAVAQLDPSDAALCGLHHLVAGLATAALRLLGLDPFLVTALLASLDTALDSTVDAAVASTKLSLDEMPAFGGPLAEILAEDHATWEVRLFAS